MTYNLQNSGINQALGEDGDGWWVGETFQAKITAHENIHEKVQQTQYIN